MAEDADETIKAFLDGSELGVMDFEVDGIAQAMRSGTGIDLDSFVAQLAELGARDGTTEAPLTRAALDASMVAAAAANRPGSIIALLLLSLEKARGAHDPGGSTDPVWGTPVLDTLQLRLIVLARRQGRRRSLSKRPVTPWWPSSSR